MRTFAAITCLLLVTTPVSAQELANRAAKIFEKGCLSAPVLALGNGSSLQDAAVAVKHVSDVFAHFDARGTSAGLVGSPEYKFKSSKGEGRFTCHVSSKHLKARDVVKKANRLIRIAGQGQKAKFLGPARFDDAPNRYIEGRRAEFESPGRKLQIELFYFISERGPVGSLDLVLDHRVSD